MTKTQSTQEKQQSLKLIQDSFIASLSGTESPFAVFEQTEPVAWQTFVTGLTGIFDSLCKSAAGKTKSVSVRLNKVTKAKLKELSQSQGKSQTRIVHELIRFHLLSNFMSETAIQFPHFAENTELWGKLRDAINTEYRLQLSLEESA